MSSCSTGSREAQTSLHRGVTWDGKERVWRARIYFLSKQVHIGRYSKEEEAAQAYDCAAVMLGVNGARALNYSKERAQAKLPHFAKSPFFIKLQERARAAQPESAFCVAAAGSATAAVYAAGPKGRKAGGKGAKGAAGRTKGHTAASNPAPLAAAPADAMDYEAIVPTCNRGDADEGSCHAASSYARVAIAVLPAGGLEMLPTKREADSCSSCNDATSQALPLAAAIAPVAWRGANAAVGPLTGEAAGGGDASAASAAAAAAAAATAAPVALAAPALLLPCGFSHLQRGGICEAMVRGNVVTTGIQQPALSFQQQSPAGALLAYQQQQMEQAQHEREQMRLRAQLLQLLQQPSKPPLQHQPQPLLQPHFTHQQRHERQQPLYQFHTSVSGLRSETPRAFGLQEAPLLSGPGGGSPQISWPPSPTFQKVTTSGAFLEAPATATHTTGFEAHHLLGEGSVDGGRSGARSSGGGSSTRSGSGTASARLAVPWPPAGLALPEAAFSWGPSAAADSAPPGARFSPAPPGLPASPASPAPAAPGLASAESSAGEELSLMVYPEWLQLPAATGPRGPAAEHPWAAPVSKPHQSAAASDTSAHQSAAAARQAAGAFKKMPLPPLEFCDEPCDPDLLSFCMSLPDDDMHMDDLSDPFCMPIWGC